MHTCNSILERQRQADPWGSYRNDTSNQPLALACIYIHIHKCIHMGTYIHTHKGGHNCCQRRNHQKAIMKVLHSPETLGYFIYRWPEVSSFPWAEGPKAIIEYFTETTHDSAFPVAEGGGIINHGGNAFLQNARWHSPTTMALSLFGMILLQTLSREWSVSRWLDFKYVHAEWEIFFQSVTRNGAYAGALQSVNCFPLYCLLL